MRKRFARYLRRKIKRGVLTIVVFLAVMTVIGWPAVTTQPGVTRDWVGDLNALRVSIEPEGEAAWPIYRDIIVNDFGESSIDDEELSELWHALENVYDFKRYPHPDEHAWDDPIFDAHRALLADAGAVFAKLDAAATKPRNGKEYARVGSPLEGEQDPDARVMGIYILMPELGRLRAIGVLNAFRARAAAAQDWDEFTTSIDSSLAMAAHTARAGILIEELVGVSIAEAPMQLLRREIVEQELPVSACTALDTSFVSRMRSREWFRASLQMELISAISTLDTFYGTNGYAGAKLWSYNENKKEFVLHASWYRRLMNANAIWKSTKQEGVDLFGERFSALEKGIEVPASAFYGFLLRFEQAEEPETVPGVLVDILMPALGRALRNNITLERDVLATRLMLRLEAIHAETGAWPDSLDAPELAELNTDPLTGHPFVYTLTPDDPHGRAYTLHAPHTPWENVGGEDFTEPRRMFEPTDEVEFPEN